MYLIMLFSLIMIITQSTMFSIYLISQANGSVLGNEKLAWRLFFDI